MKFNKYEFNNRLNEAYSAKKAKDKHFSQAKLSEITGISPQLISKYLNNTPENMSITNCAKLAEALDVSYDTLFGLDKKNDKLEINNMKEAYDVLTSFIACFTNIGTKIVHHPPEEKCDAYAEIVDYIDEYDELVISIYDSKFVEFFSNIEKIISSKDNLFSPSLKAQAINNQYEQMEKTPVENDFELPF